MPAFSPKALLVFNQHMRRRQPGEEAGEMRRKRPVRPRVKLNRDAVWALLDQLGIPQNELARRSGIFPGSPVSLDERRDTISLFQGRCARISRCRNM